MHIPLFNISDMTLSFTAARASYLLYQTYSFQQKVVQLARDR